jgi:hypothetical protein
VHSVRHTLRVTRSNVSCGETTAIERATRKVWHFFRAQKIRKDFEVKCEIFKCDLNDVKQVKKLAEFAKKEFSNWRTCMRNMIKNM